jgi:hypothetical protein
VTRADRGIAIGLFIVTLVTYAAFFGGGGWNQNAQLDLTRALVTRQTLHVDGFDGNTGDLSDGRGGHKYINKPPGVSLLATPTYAIVYGVQRALDVDPNAWLPLTIAAWLCTVATCSVSAALIAAVLYLHARRAIGVPPRAALGVTLAIAFGTILFPYATMLFAHTPSALFLLLAFVLRDDKPLLAGMSAGFAGICFYPCILAAIVLLVLVVMRSRAGALRFIAGGLPFALLLGAYQWICFGSPFATTVEGSRGFIDGTLFLGVLRLPNAEVLWRLTFSAHRGLFYVSPVLLFAFVGAVMMIRRRVMRPELVAITAITLLFLAFFAGFNGWHGGWAWGPRYLTSIIPLMAIPMFYAASIARAVWITLAAASIAMQLLATTVDPMPPNDYRNPIAEYLLPPFLTGHLPPNVAAHLGFPNTHVGKASINPQSVDEGGHFTRHAPYSREATWASWNAGELLTGPATRSSLLPIMAWMALGSLALLRRTRSAL